jgi:hypothetical protein
MKGWTRKDIERLRDGKLTMPPKKSKYGNKKTEVDGITFHSKKEAARYGILKMLESRGIIRDLRLQVPFQIKINGFLVCTYFADFVYMEEGRQVVEDSKGVKTKDFILKQKLMRAVKGIEIKLT